MKKILVVSNMYPSKKFQLFGIFVKNSIEILKNNGFNVYTISLKKNDNKLLKIIAYIVFYFRIIIYGILHNNYIIYSHYASHTAIPLLVLSAIKKVEIVMNVHGNDIVPETNKDLQHISKVKRILHKSKLIISPSMYFADILKKEYNISGEKIIVYPSGGVDTDVFVKLEKKDSCKKIGLDSNWKYIGYVSRIEEKKGWELYLKACQKILKKYEDTRLLVVGSGSQEEEFLSLVKKLNLEKKMIKYNFIPQEMLVYIYNSMEVFVFPTYRKSESLGLVGLEAMSCQTKTILPDLYGPSSYGINNYNCYVFESKNEKSLYSIIEKALNDVNNNGLCENARNTAISYGKNNTQKQLINIFNSLIK